jgi:uncharacterized protein YjbJ (UPF0337 family)
MGINKDQIEGRAKEAAGKIQEVAGKTVGSGSQEAKGMVNKVAGKAQAAYGDAKETIRDHAKETAKDSQHKHG